MQRRQMTTGTAFHPRSSWGKLCCSIQKHQTSLVRLFNRLALVPLLVDTILRPNQPLPWQLTLFAGSVTLKAGVHTLALRPRPGEDIRADFVVLSTDPTIAGYGFGVKSGSGK